MSLELKEYVKYLGLLIDANLSWRNHINHITLKISKNIGIMSRLRHTVPQSILLYIYKSLVLPYLSYGIAAWGRAANYLINNILILQKRALRTIYFADRRDHAVPHFVANTHEHSLFK